MSKFSRNSWGARAPRHKAVALSRGQVIGMALHWPAMTKRLTTTAAVKAAIKSWQGYHMDTQGWSDIGYQVAFDNRGNRYTLRGWTKKSGANGNDDLNLRYGAILLVLAPGEAPSEAMKKAVRKEIKKHRKRFTKSTRIVGHGDIRPGGTECPGPAVRAAIAAGDFEPVAKPSKAKRHQPLRRALLAAEKAARKVGRNPLADRLAKRRIALRFKKK